MNNIIFWLDAQIAEATRMEKELDNLGRHEDSMYWWGRGRALQDVKGMLTEKEERDNGR
jgi:hypothetical protein